LKIELEDIRNKIQSISMNKFCYLIIFILVSTFLFFVNSNRIFSKDSDFESTKLFESQQIGVKEMQLTKRTYNPKTGLAEFIFKLDSKISILETNAEEKQIKFAVREKSNIINDLHAKVRRLDDNNIIVLATLPKRWSVLSIAVAEEDSVNTKNVYEESGVKFYTNSNDIDEDISLNEKNTNEYYSDITEIEIKSADKSIKEIQNKIKKERKLILEKKNKISEIEENKKYQTETELNLSNQNIESIKLGIKEITDNIEKLKAQQKETNDKIKKLDDKKFYYLRNSKKNI